MIATWGAPPWTPLRLIASAAQFAVKPNGFQHPRPRHTASLRRCVARELTMYVRFKKRTYG